jgi:hypothetical protein
MTRKKEKKAPVKLKQQPVQLDLFKSVTSIETNSQSLRLWESLSNAVFEDKKAVSRIKDKFLDSITDYIEFDGVRIDIEKDPARVKEKDSETSKEYFPLKKEYKIMEVLIKLAVDEMESGFYSSENLWPNLGIWVSLHSIYKTIKSTTGKAKYNYTQIKEAITILSKTHVSMVAGNNEIAGTLIQMHYGSDLDDNKKAHFLINFHPIISKLALEGAFRQYNLPRSLKFNGLTTCFLYKKFVHNFKQAKTGEKPYHFLLSTLEKEMPHLRKWDRTERKIQKLNESLEDMKQEGIVSTFSFNKRYTKGHGGHKKTVDCYYEVLFSKDFIREQIEANVIKDNTIVYKDDGTVFKKPNLQEYRKQFKTFTEANQKYMLDLDRWHKLSKQQKTGENIVHRTFKK